MQPGAQLSEERASRAEALFYTAPGRAEIRPVRLAPPAPGMVTVRTLFSALSRGTERLVFRGEVPESEWQRMRAPHQEGDFPFPVKYGYAAVGVVEDGPEALRGSPVFALHPHQTRFRLPAEEVVPLPAKVPPGRAVLTPNAETALNAIWDAELEGGERVLVVGTGVVGSLLAAMLARLHGPVDVTDRVGDRARALAEFGARFVAPESLGDDYDVTFHTTATAEGLALALGSAAFEGRIVELSWFGARPVSVPLGGAFHARRLTLKASQVGHVAPARRESTSRRERLAEALGHLADPRFERFITGEVAFHALPGLLSRLLAPDAPGLATRIRYPGGGRP